MKRDGPPRGTRFAVGSADGVVLLAVPSGERGLSLPTPVAAGAVGPEFDSRREPMATACQRVRLVADLTMHVPRDAAGDLECGAANVLDGVDAVSAVEAVDVTDLRPRLNDLQVDATVTVAVDAPEDGDAEAAGRTALAGGFGIDAVEGVRVDHAQAGAETPVQEYG